MNSSRAIHEFLTRYSRTILPRVGVGVGVGGRGEILQACIRPSGSGDSTPRCMRSSVAKFGGGL